MSAGIPPSICKICYFHYNNDKVPLILPQCGHTFCKECLNIILNDKEITCPECKQTFLLSSNDIKSLPRNRALLDMIVFSENKEKKTGKIFEEINAYSLYEKSLNKLEKTYLNILKENTFITDINEVLVHREIDEVIDSIIQTINDYRDNLKSKVKKEFNKIELIKGFSNHIKNFKDKLFLYRDIRLDNITEKSLKNNKSFFKEHDLDIISDVDIDYLNESSPINHITHIEKQPISMKDAENDIQLIQLLDLTLERYSKDIFDPCNYFFVNKIQREQIISEIQKLLPMILDFDEQVFTSKLEEFNSSNQKKLFKQLQDIFQLGNLKKIKFVLSHFKFNPNFIYSEAIDSINTLTQDNISNPFLRINQSINPLRNSNRHYNIINQSYNLLLTDKLYSMYHLIKQIKDKNDSREIVKFLIEEQCYVPFNIDVLGGNVDIKLFREYDWIINLGLF